MILTPCAYRNCEITNVESDEIPKNDYCSSAEYLTLLRDYIAKYNSSMLRRNYILYKAFLGVKIRRDHFKILFALKWNFYQTGGEHK